MQLNLQHWMVNNNNNSLLQGRCKSCYAFAVTGALESMKALESRKLKVLGNEKNKLTSLSEQNIIDCSGD